MLDKKDLLLYDSENKLEPLEYSNGKNQLDVVNEILDAFEDNRIVTLEGEVGSGKSIVSLRVALEMGGGVISVPTKVLGQQYYEDYSDTGKMYFKHPEEERKSKISPIEGRNSFECPVYNEKATYEKLPCLRPLSENESRIDVLKVGCPKWSYLFPEEPRGEIGKEYKAIDEKWYWCYSSRDCPYFSQYEMYSEADVLIMNSAKFNTELAMERLPDKPLYVIDECDLYLDRLAIKVTISDSLVYSIISDLKDTSNTMQVEILKDRWDNREDNPEVLPETLYQIMEITDVGERWTGLYWQLKEMTKFKSITTYDIKENEITYTVPEPNVVLGSKLRKTNAKFLLMSASLHSQDVMKSIFGINPPRIEGETKMPGKLRVQNFSGVGKVSYDRWQDEEFRERYFTKLKSMLKNCPKPALVLVHAFKYLPEDIREELRESDGVVKKGDIIYSTTLKRGANMGGMESLIILKKPFPSLGDPLYKSMKERLGDKFWSFYKDKANRELKQQIGRVLRSAEDDVKLYSPDTKVLKEASKYEKNAFER